MSTVTITSPLHNDHLHRDFQVQGTVTLDEGAVADYRLRCTYPDDNTAASPNEFAAINDDEFKTWSLDVSISTDGEDRTFTAHLQFKDPGTGIFADVDPAVLDEVFGLSNDNNFATFTAVGDHNYTVPQNINVLRIELWGAGGGGGSADQSAGGAGGGAGAMVQGIMNVTPDDSYTVRVGQGGAANTAGEDSTFGFGETIVFYAGGGGGGGVGDNFGAGGTFDQEHVNFAVGGSAGGTGFEGGFGGGGAGSPAGGSGGDPFGQPGDPGNDESPGEGGAAGVYAHSSGSGLGINGCRGGDGDSGGGGGAGGAVGQPASGATGGAGGKGFVIIHAEFDESL